MLDISAIGNRIKELRTKRGLTQNEFAKEIHVSFQAVSNWERGIAPPELENLIRIAEYFGILTDDLLRSKSEELYLGIDGGGTKTEFALISADGYLKKRSVKSGCNPNDIGYSKMLALLTDGIGDILTQFPSVKAAFLGIAGISAGDHAKQLQADLKKRYPQINVKIRNDSFNLFALDDSSEMVVISGTGSVVFVKDGDSYKRLGGWGYLLDNAGSAYDIGRDEISISLKKEDLCESRSILGKLLCEKMKTNTLWEHINTVYSLGKPYIASFAATVFEAYRLGDEDAIQIIDKNAHAIADWLNAGTKLYGAAPSAIASGGIFENFGDIMSSHVKKYSSVKLVISDLAPIYGACKNACAIENCKISDEFYKNFKKTYGEIKQ